MHLKTFPLQRSDIPRGGRATPSRSQSNSSPSVAGWKSSIKLVARATSYARSRRHSQRCRRRLCWSRLPPCSSATRSQRLVRPDHFTAFYFGPGRAAKYCDSRVCLSVCLSVSRFARISQKPRLHTSLNFFSACGLLPRLRFPLKALRYDMHFPFCGWRHVCP